MGQYKKSELIYGVGVNDADYVVYPMIDGMQGSCHFYRKWHNMIQRCYSEKTQKKYPSYADCKVCDEWLTFSNFKAWMEKQDWQGKELDKDLLSKGGKVYSPETCAFVSRKVNVFIMGGIISRDLRMTGATRNKLSGKFIAQCSNPVTNKQEYLGRFSDEKDAHLAWKKRKHELACQLADLQTDERVANALRTRYL